jgi:hypothetical protein
MFSRYFIGDIDFIVLGHYWYADRSVGNFALKVEKKLKLPLVVITGDHGAPLFHLGRRVEYLEFTNANKFLENANHYLIVHKESDLQQIDEKLRRIIVSLITMTDSRELDIKN